MNGYGGLASTGATITLAGVVLNQLQLAAIAAAIIIVGALIVRKTFRRGRTPSDV